MKIRLPAKELKYALTGLTKCIPAKPSIPVLQCVRIESAGQKVRLSGTDLDSTLTYTCMSAEVLEPGIIVVDARRLKDLVARATKDEALIQTQDGTEIQVSLYGPLGDRDTALPGSDPVEWPEDIPQIKVKPTDVPFAELYRSLVTFGSTDPHREILNGVYIEAKNSQHTLVATDGRRLTTMNSIRLPISKSCVVPRHKFLSWNQLKGDCQLGLSGDGHFRVESGPWSFTCRTVDGTYPNWRQVVPSPDGANGIDLAEEDLPVLEDAVRTLPGGDKETKAVTIIQNAECVCVAAQDPDTEAWSYRDLPNSRFYGAGTSVNRDYLREAVKAGFYNFRWSDALSPLIAKNESSLHVLMPLRSEAPPTKNPKTNSTPKIKEQPVIQENPESKPDQPPVEQLWLTYQTVRDRVRELNSALSELGDQIRTVKKNDKAVKSELDNARGVLSKLQSISI